MKDFKQIKLNLKKDFSTKKALKVSLIGDNATQLLTQALRGIGFEEGYDLQIQEADYNQIDRQIFDSTSNLYQYNPDYIVIFLSTHKLLHKYNKRQLVSNDTFANDEIKHIELLYQCIKEKLNSKIIIYNFPEINDYLFGNFGNSIENSFIFQIRLLNIELMKFVLNHKDCFICDLSSIQNKIGKDLMFNANIYTSTEMVLSIDCIPYVAQQTVNIIQAIQGKIKKCIILDLDNTLWGGVIGDDGLNKIQIGHLGIGKAFTEFQHWLKKLRERGIILAVCSKNDENIAKEPFEKHPDMVLRLEDIALFVANWENKADNIRYIQQSLNIGFDSMVFLDDNPFERNIVRENISEITVPELPEDPAEYLEYLYNLNLFETISYSGEDYKRTKQYQIQARREIEKISFTNENEYLKSLEMKSEVSPFNSFNTPRIAQLSQRSNQYNLRTVRYTDEDILQIGKSKGYATFSFTLEDKFGDNGLICVVVLKKTNSQELFIESWFMSCRVLKRGMEKFILNILVEYARKNNFKTLRGEYIPTQKNGLVKDHYPALGFTQHESNWVLTIDGYKNLENFITIK